MRLSLRGSVSAFAIKILFLWGSEMIVITQSIRLFGSLPDSSVSPHLRVPPGTRDIRQMIKSITPDFMSSVMSDLVKKELYLSGRIRTQGKNRLSTINKMNER